MANNLLQQQLANQAYNTIAGTGTLTPYPYGGVMVSAGGVSGGSAGWPLWVTQQGYIQPAYYPTTDTYTVSTKVDFSEEEIMRAEQIMEECDAARTP